MGTELPDDAGSLQSRLITAFGNIMRTDMPEHPTKKKRPFATWLVVCSPVLLLLVFIALAVHVRVGLGHWPTPMLEHYDTAAYRAHALALIWVIFFTVFAAIPLWLLMLCFRPLRISLKTHLIQAGVYVAGWVLIIMYGAVDPGRFLEWFFD
jgi:magnesium-transporting ATPase (P-type)